MNMLALPLLYRSVQKRLPEGHSFEAFMQTVRDWDVVPLEMNGQLVGAVLTKGNELHVGYEFAPRASVRAHIRKVLLPMIRRFGYAVTTVQAANVRGIRFCQRLGFYATAETDGVLRLRCDRCSYD